MLFKKMIPKSRDVEKTQENIIKLSQKLKNIITQYDWENKNKINDAGLDFACFLYTLDFYRQVMTLKYNKTVTKTIIRTIFINLENAYKQLGNSFEKNYMLNMYIKLSKSLHEIYQISKEDNVDELEMVAMYLLTDECQMSENELVDNHGCVIQVSTFFFQVINLNLDEI